jgi:hypothetical protein
MAGAIAVSQAFMADWQLFCERAGLDRREQAELRQAVREDFATVGAHISETAEVYRFCDDVWGYVPDARLARGYCASKGWYAADENIWMRFGPLLLAKICAQVAGRIPWPE